MNGSNDTKTADAAPSSTVSVDGNTVTVHAEGETQPQQPTRPVMSPRMRHAMMLVGGPRAARGIPVAQPRPKPVKQPKPQQWRMELLLVDSPVIGQVGQRSDYLNRKELVNHVLQQLKIAGVEVRLVGCSRRE